MWITKGVGLHITLFVLTCASTYFVGGPLYSISVMAILLSHEMGHYLMSRRYGIPATLPYFIPFPISLFGTLGAVIKMKGVVVNKKALFDVGVAGPLAGFIVSLPFIVMGLKLSTVQLVTKSAAQVQLGDPLIFTLLQRLLIGPSPAGYDVVLHPFGYAGWVGVFVTALNLLPIGQLDGGHVIYALFGEKSKWVCGACIVALGAITVFYNPAWLALVILLLIFGVRHPEPLDSETELDGKRRLLAVGVLVIFILSFTPVPFPDLGFSNGR
jgi:membrane-associated protease RseP (regulator of RpoE activity)